MIASLRKVHVQRPTRGYARYQLLAEIHNNRRYKSVRKCHRISPRGLSPFGVHNTSRLVGLHMLQLQQRTIRKERSPGVRPINRGRLLVQSCWKSATFYVYPSGPSVVLAVSVWLLTRFEVLLMAKRVLLGGGSPSGRLDSE